VSAGPRPPPTNGESLTAALKESQRDSSTQPYQVCEARPALGQSGAKGIFNPNDIESPSRVHGFDCFGFDFMYHSPPRVALFHQATAGSGVREIPYRLFP